MIDSDAWEACEYRLRHESSREISLREFVFDRWESFNSSPCVADYHQHSTEKAELIIPLQDGYTGMVTLYVPPDLSQDEVLLCLIIATEDMLCD